MHQIICGVEGVLQKACFPEVLTEVLASWSFYVIEGKHAFSWYLFENMANRQESRLFSWFDHTLQLVSPSTAVKLRLLFDLNLKVKKVLIAIAHVKERAMNGLSDQCFFLAIWQS